MDRGDSPSVHEERLDRYFSGDRLYGDDFSPEEIGAWYEDEREGYANLGAKRTESYTYAYHALNALHGFRHLPDRRFSRALGLGSAYGDEYAPIADRVEQVTILEPSDAFVRDSVHGLPARYVRPSVDGTLPFPDRTFDLVTCLGVLHHIPNVTHVVREMYRCLRPGGFALVREPVISMGDWRHPRRGLTRRERGIPLPLFRGILAGAGFEVRREALCVVPLIPYAWHLFGREAFNSPLATRIDQLCSRLLAWNLRYHATSLARRKLRPVAAYYVLTR